MRLGLDLFRFFNLWTNRNIRADLSGFAGGIKCGLGVSLTFAASSLIKRCFFPHTWCCIDTDKQTTGVLNNPNKMHCISRDQILFPEPL